MYDESRKNFHFSDPECLPAALSALFAVRNQKDFCLLPIRKYREVAGFLLLGVPLEGFFSRNNDKFYQRAAQAVSRAIAGAILFSKSKQRDDFESLMGELNQKKFLGVSVESMLDLYLGSLIDLLGVERSSLMRYDDDAKALSVCAAKGYKVYPISGARIKWGEGIAGLALKDSKIISINRMKDIKDYRPEIKVKSLLCVPLIDAGNPLGVVNLSTINYYKIFEKSDIEIVHQIANRMSSILKDFS